MTKSVTWLYAIFISLLAAGVIALMLALNPKIIIPSVIGVAMGAVMLFYFVRSMSKRNEETQVYIARRNGIIASVAVVIMLAIFFSATARHYDMSTWKFLSLWFGY